MSENQKDKAEQVLNNTEAAANKTENTDSKKVSFGALTPLTTAQIITLLVGTSSSNSSYGGY
jgi:hypothetical protein